MESSPLEIIMRQTDYDRETAQEKLSEHDGKYENVIKEFMGINLEKKNVRVKPGSLHQEIFTQIRKQMDLSIKDFNRIQNDKLEKELQNTSS